MTLRLKLTALFCVLVASCAITGGLWSLHTLDTELEVQTDRSMVLAASEIIAQRGAIEVTIGAGPAGDPGLWQASRNFERILFQVISSDGEVLLPAASGVLPVGVVDRRVASGAGPALQFHDIEVDGEPYRVLTVSLVRGGAAQVARSLGEVQRLHDAFARRLALIAGVLMCGGGVLTMLLVRRSTRRLVRLAAVAESVASTGNLDVAVQVQGRDEAARVSRAFASMLAALRDSREQQQRLVQDAGHELRTPLTSLRTNVAMLERFERLNPQEREDLRTDLRSETEELVTLVGELVLLATGTGEEEEIVELDMAELASDVVERARRRSRVEIRLDTHSAPLLGRRGLLYRAVNNLVENAVKFDPSGSAIDVVVRAGSVEVRDRGAGISQVDALRVFDRFWRAESSRGTPGSGLGLSIVAAAAELHGGTVHAGPREGGGAIVGFSFVPS